ncbi:CBS domain-containing protein [Oceanobacillus piezotolerans]|uniref:CBS domain-containing protein n=1 Tax=Oceanobacillus piezotolerans TaxID=2448030 RepID=A0A498D8L9_9BACI|nr:cyclic-di-AMP-binding protein CbpB [Oceanobacillus piezotolerans]RLL45177.1 CBS domain-containing protein [Oceanobacillus piezotolerans]
MSMIQENRQLTDITVAELMIPSEKVAHVQVNNPSEHALLVLVKSGYSAIPVLDSSYKLLGIIGKSAILNQILGLERFEMELLSEIRVKEIMTTDIPTLSKEDNLLDGLNAMINHAFVCVEDEDGIFDGILTRRAILKQLKKEIYTTNLFKK